MMSKSGQHTLYRKRLHSGIALGLQLHLHHTQLQNIAFKILLECSAYKKYISWLLYNQKQWNLYLFLLISCVQGLIVACGNSNGQKGKNLKSERCHSNPISQLFGGMRERERENDYTVSLYSPLYAIKCLTHHVGCFMASLHHDCFIAAFSECFVKLNQTNQKEYFQTPTHTKSVFCVCIFCLFFILYLLHFPFHTCLSSSHLSLSIFFIFQFTTSQSY